MDPGARLSHGAHSESAGDSDMTTYDNAPPMDDVVIFGRCCGELHGTVDCSVCLQAVKPDLPLTPPNIILGTD